MDKPIDVRLKGVKNIIYTLFHKQNNLSSTYESTKINLITWLSYDKNEAVSKVSLNADNADVRWFYFGNI